MREMKEMRQASSCNHPLRNEFLGKLRQNAFILDTRVLTSQQLLLMKTSPPGWVEGVSSSHYLASFFISLISSAKIGILGRIFKVWRFWGLLSRYLGPHFSTVEVADVLVSGERQTHDTGW